MGSDCSNCSKCDLGIISENQNEIDRQSLEYRNGNINREQMIINNNKILKYYSEHLSEITYLQINIKKFLEKLKHSSNAKEEFYNKHYGTIELSKENLQIINPSQELADISNKEQLCHKIQNNNEKFKTLSQKYSSLQNNDEEIDEEKKPYKVKNYRTNIMAKYTGDMINGKQHGYGIQEWEDGAKYEGEWKNGRTNGYGVFYHPDGDIYKGYWKDDKAHGHGIYIKNEEEQYEGEWADDCQDGYGIETWYDGSTYKGYYKKGQKNGFGEYLWPDGSKYSGNWKNNIQNGFGIYIYIDNKKSYEGYFKNNAFEGRGHYIKKDGTEYLGNFFEGKKNGLGKYLFEDGRSYTGFWENGKQHGLGLYINEKKEEKYGVWVNGKRNRWLEEDELDAIKSANDKYYDEIINFSMEDYKFTKEKEELKKYN